MSTSPRRTGRGLSPGAADAAPGFGRQRLGAGRQALGLENTWEKHVKEMKNHEKNMKKT